MCATGARCTSGEKKKNKKTPTGEGNWNTRNPGRVVSDLSTEEDDDPGARYGHPRSRKRSDGPTVTVRSPQSRLCIPSCPPADFVVHSRLATAERQNGGESEPDPDPIPDWARAFTVRLPYPLPCRANPNRECKFLAMPLGSFTHLPA
uniref:Uncharacterized protein n=1 Tax=Anopheles melas TaxID=34690 RepID=A0A182UBJ3_9DIPT